MIYIGIDPGLTGAITIIDEDIHIIDTPITVIKSGKKNKRVYIESEMAKILIPYRRMQGMAVIEKQTSMPGQGVASTLSIGIGEGLWLGMLAALQIPYDRITPQSWKKEMLTGMGKEKSASCYKAQQLYPDGEFFGPRGGALDGRGDSFLMARYCTLKHS